MTASRPLPSQVPGPGAARRGVTAAARLVRGVLAAVALAALVAGVPWGLARFVGWPLPDHLPTPAEVLDVLLGSFGPGLLINVLALLCWIAWAGFLVDLAGCVVDSVRYGRLPDLSAGRPTRAVAAVLVTAVVVGVLGNRALATVTTPPSSLDPPRVMPRPVATAAPWPDGWSPGSHEITLLTQSQREVQAPPQPPTSVTVRAPINGIHDSLWRIAARTLGDGQRWPEIFEVNRGMSQ